MAERGTGRRGAGRRGKRQSATGQSASDQNTLDQNTRDQHTRDQRTRGQTKRGQSATHKSGQATIGKRQYEVLAAFRYELRRFLRHSEEMTRRHGITPLQYQLLLHVKGFPGREYASVTELAERLQAKHHGVVSLVTRSEAAGLVQRRVGATDRRLVHVYLTAKGEQKLARLADLHRRELLQLQGRFFVPDAEALE